MTGQSESPALPVYSLVGRHRLPSRANNRTAFAGLPVIELGAVLVDQSGSLPGVEALHQWAGRFEQFANLVRLPMPGELDLCSPKSGHSDLRSSYQQALGKWDHVGLALVAGVLGVVDSGDLLECLAARCS